MVNKLFAAVVVFLFGINIFAGYKVIKDPQPTHIETPGLYKNLKLIKTISGDFEEEYFLAQPSSIAVDDEGSFFVFDSTDPGCLDSSKHKLLSNKTLCMLNLSFFLSRNFIDFCFSFL